MKQITITVPDNRELKKDKDGNTYTIVEKEKKLAYEDVARKLFPEYNLYYFISGVGIEESYNDNNCSELPTNTTSKRQVAKYLNDGWRPNWYRTEIKYYI